MILGMITGVMMRRFPIPRIDIQINLRKDQVFIQMNLTTAMMPGLVQCSSSGTSSNGGNNEDDQESSNNDGENSDGVNQFSSSSGSQSGYQLTVNVPSHPFGKSSVSIYITTENGHTDSKTISPSSLQDSHHGHLTFPPIKEIL